MFVLAGVTLAALASAAHGQAIIGTKTLVLGVGELGNLNIPYKGDIKGLLLPKEDPLDLKAIGLRVGDGSLSGVDRGILAEGWGAGVATKSKAPLTFLDSCGVDAESAVNVVAKAGGFSGTDGGMKARSRVICGEQKKIGVTHEYGPSGKTEQLFKVKVTIKNLTKKTFPQVIYRRAMDWDIDPAPFKELVTIKGTGTANYESSHDGGFCALDPADTDNCLAITDGTDNVDFEDGGPADHGAQVTLKFGKLKAGNSVSFTTYYGVAPDESSAKKAITAVGAKLYTFGQSSEEGKPATFIWAYKGDKKITKGKGSLPGLVAPPPATDDKSAKKPVSAGMSAEEKQKANSG
jgi:hypothetical protein